MSVSIVQTATTMDSVNPIKPTAALCWLGWVFDFYDLILIAFLIPMIETSLHIDATMGAWMMGVGLGASGLGGILFGWLADVYGRKKVLCFTVVLFSLGMLLTGFVQTPVQFLMARFITGLGLGGEWAVGHALIAESVPAETRARWSAFLQSGEPIGVALAAIVGFIIAPHVGWRVVFMVSSLAGFLALARWCYLKESVLWEQTPPRTTQTRFKELVPFFGNYKGIMIIALVLAIFKLGTYWTCYTWLPRFIMESFGTAIGKSALWILCGQVGQFMGMYAFGFVADTIGRRWAFTLFSGMTAAALFPLAFFWNTLFTDYPLVFWLLMLLLGFGSGCTAGFGALLAELFPTVQRTFAMGTVYNLARSVQVFAPVVVAGAVTTHGITGGLLVPATLACLTAAWVWMLPEKRGARLEAH